MNATVVIIGVIMRTALAAVKCQMVYVTGLSRASNSYCPAPTAWRHPMKFEGGCTRAVLLVGPYAIKFPRVRYGWVKLLQGLLSNMTEARFTSLSGHFALAPTLFAIPGGFLNVQRRCQPLTDLEWSHIESMCRPDADFGPADWNGFSCDFKRDNFGTINGTIVLLDFGEYT